MYILKQLFFSISVNSGRIFTSPLRGSVNILPLFTEIEKNNCSLLSQVDVITPKGVLVGNLKKKPLGGTKILFYGGDLK